MALHPHQTIYGPLLTTARTYGQFRITVTGRIVEARYDSDTLAHLATKLGFEVNGGVGPYAGGSSDWPTILNGTSLLSDTLDFAVTRGDVISLKSLPASLAAVGQKLYATIFVEDDLPTYFGGTSSSSQAIGAGSKSFTTQKGLAYTVGSRVRVASSASPTTNYMEGVVTAYAGTTLTVLITLAVGSGTHTDWLLSLAGEIGVAGPTGATGSVGPGVPTGGTTGQILKKNSGTNYDTGWEDAPSGDPTLAGDVTGAGSANTVEKIQGTDVNDWSTPTVVTVFEDDFNDNSIDPIKWVKADSADITIAETSSQLQMTSDASYSGTLNIASLTSVSAFDFTARQADVDIVSTTGLGQNAFDSAGMYFQLTDIANGNNYIQVFIDQLSFVLRLSNNGTNSQTSLSYSTADTKWRVVHDSVNSQILFYTFTSGSWTLRFTSATMTWSPTAVKLTLGAYIYGGSAVSKTAIFDNVAVGDVSAGVVGLNNNDALIWDSSHSKWVNAQVIGVAPFVGSPPSGPPSGIPGGFSLLCYHPTLHRLYAWNGTTWDHKDFDA